MTNESLCFYKVWPCYMSLLSYASFWNRPLPLTRPLLASRHEHKHAHTHTVDVHAKFQPHRAKTAVAKERETFVDGRMDGRTDRQSRWSQVQVCGYCCLCLLMCACGKQAAFIPCFATFSKHSEHSMRQFLKEAFLSEDTLT